MRRAYLLPLVCLLPSITVWLAAVLLGLDGYAIDLEAALEPPSRLHPLGCDALGRDMLARLAEGITLSVQIGLIVLAACALIGTGIGLLAGWLGGWVDALLMRIADVLLAFPGILLAIALAAMLGPSIENIVVALVVVGWVSFARLARVQVLSLRPSPFIEAAIACGSCFPYIAIHHLLPNIAAPLLVEATFSLAAIILAEAGLSFLGIGVQPPAASLGTMIREGTRYMLVAPGQVILPGFLLFSLIMAVNLAGDRLRDRLDVRTMEKS